MQRDANLIKALVIYLQGVEASKQPGDSLRPMQPPNQALGFQSEFPNFGHSDEQVEKHLRILIDEGLVVGGKLPWGINFDGLTPAGRALI